MEQGELEQDTTFIKRLKGRLSQLESQNKTLTDMVEIQSEKISRLEAPKSCDRCKHQENIYPYCSLGINICSIPFKDYYESKDD